MATIKTLPAPVVRKGPKCHCCRGKLPRKHLRLETVHFRPVCSERCKDAVDTAILSDPPEVLRELFIEIDD
jgi:hypothetical protein